MEDPFSGPAAQHKRYVAAVRVSRHRWLFYEFDTGDPEDVISRKRKLDLKHERDFLTDAGGEHTLWTPDVFNNQQIMQTSKRRLKVDV